MDLTPIAQPPWTGLGKRLEGLCRKGLHDFDLVPANGKIAIALSGGKDSLTLLFLLHAISGRGFPPFELYALHVGGSYSCGAGIEENFLKKVCEQLQVPFFPLQASTELDELECYSCSRIRRKTLFAAAKNLGVETIAFGHHRDDVVNTLLMNLFQKGEFASMLPKIPMHHYGVTIIRPLYYLAEAEIIQFAQHHRFKRITCQCPVGQHSRRKEVDQLLTEYEALFPHIRSNLALATLLHGSDKALRLPKD